MKTYNVTEIRIEKELSSAFDLMVNANLEKETSEDLFYLVRIKKPENFELFQFLKKEVGEGNFLIGEKSVILYDNLKIEIINKTIEKIREMWKYSKETECSFHEHSKGITVRWDTSERIPF